jgi:hypothetical protein
VQVEVEVEVVSSEHVILNFKGEAPAGEFFGDLAFHSLWRTSTTACHTFYFPSANGVGRFPFEVHKFPERADALHTRFLLRTFTVISWPKTHQPHSFTHSPIARISTRRLITFALI